MSITSLFKRAPIAVAVIVGGMAVSSGADALSDDTPRSTLTIGVDACPSPTGAGEISVGYDDHVDGHTPQQVVERLADQSGELWSSTELHQVDGDYFNVHNFPATETFPITSSSQFTYSVSMTYEDGVTQTQSVSLAIAEHCNPGSPTTVQPAPRFELSKAAADCNGGSDPAAIAFRFADAADGQVPREYALQVAFGDEMYGYYDRPPGSDGETFEVAVPGPLFPINRLEATTYTLTVWVKYDDAVVVADSESYDVTVACEEESPTTSLPSGSLPQTGSSMTWGMTAIGGLLSAAGGALVLGSRRRRTV